jgi:WD40-like Beta Propeller Repeat
VRATRDWDEMSPSRPASLSPIRRALRHCGRRTGSRLFLASTWYQLANSTSSLLTARNPSSFVPRGAAPVSFLRVPWHGPETAAIYFFVRGKLGCLRYGRCRCPASASPSPWFKLPRLTSFGQISRPDGKWIVYQSDKSGRYQIYVAPFPGPGSRGMVSSDGGAQPLWRGNEIFFWSLGDLEVAGVHFVRNGLQVNTAHTLFSLPLSIVGTIRHQYDVTRDGRRFIINMPTHPQSNEPIPLVINWLGELKQ